MKLALSSRLWESVDGYAIDQMQHLQITRDLGYDGVELRYPLLPVGDAAISEVATAMRDLNLIGVFGPCAGVPDDDAGWNDATRVMDTLQALGAKWIKCLPIDESHVPGMTKLADMAQARGMILCTQLHTGTLTDTAARTEKFLKQVDHPAVGVIYDSAHLQIAGDDDIAGAVQRLRPWLQVVNVQCLAPGAQSGDWDLALPGDPGATDLVATMRAIPDDDLWWMVMPACDPNNDSVAVARAYKEALLGSA